MGLVEAVFGYAYFVILPLGPAAVAVAAVAGLEGRLGRAPARCTGGPLLVLAGVPALWVVGWHASKWPLFGDPDLNGILAGLAALTAAGAVAGALFSPGARLTAVLAAIAGADLGFHVLVSQYFGLVEGPGGLSSALVRSLVDGGDALMLFVSGALGWQALLAGDLSPEGPLGTAARLLAEPGMGAAAAVYAAAALVACSLVIAADGGWPARTGSALAATLAAGLILFFLPLVRV